MHRDEVAYGCLGILGVIAVALIIVAIMFYNGLLVKKIYIIQATNTPLSIFPVEEMVTETPTRVPTSTPKPTPTATPKPASTILPGGDSIPLGPGDSG